MATTFALVIPTLADLDLKLKEIPSASRANIDLVDSSRTPTGFTADYVYNAGSAKDVVSVKARRNYDAKTDTTSCSLRLTAAIRQTVSETGEVTDLPVEAVIAWNYQGEVCADTALLVQVVEAAAALVFKDLSGANGLPTTATIDSFDRGVITQLY